MNYESAIQNVFAQGTIPDGYSGKFARVNFAFDPESGKTIVLRDTPRLYHTYQSPPAVDAREAMWLLLNHPSSNASRIIHTT